jgi:hypothetical protein
VAHALALPELHNPALIPVAAPQQLHRPAMHVNVSPVQISPDRSVHRTLALPPPINRSFSITFLIDLGITPLEWGSISSKYLVPVITMGQSENYYFPFDQNYFNTQILSAPISIAATIHIEQ